MESPVHMLSHRHALLQGIPKWKCVWSDQRRHWGLWRSAARRSAKTFLGPWAYNRPKHTRKTPNTTATRIPPATTSRKPDGRGSGRNIGTWHKADDNDMADGACGRRPQEQENGLLSWRPPCNECECMPAKGHVGPWKIALAPVAMLALQHRSVSNAFS